MRLGFSIDPRQALSEPDELTLVELGARLGYESAWTPSGPDAAAFDRCLRWYRASGLPTGISVVPASGQPPAFYAEQARRVWEETGGRFTLGVGSGQMPNAAAGMRRYVTELRALLPDGPPIYLAALGPLMLGVAGELADGVALNWCSPEQAATSRDLVECAARDAGRPDPVVAAYIRTSVDPNPAAARSALGTAALRYALGPGHYRRHFARMGFEEELRRLEAGDGEPSDTLLAEAGAAGAPGEVRPQLQRLAERLDLAIVRVLVTPAGDAESARLTLEECRPA
ncbi:MAG: LLM class flavin-dependent oxidoreductase [Streptosporangiales bacterium]|nr:LLM class flavin-dependent oxidoreductase [Streptosporangiales bacterium]